MQHVDFADLSRLDRDVRRAHAALEAWRMRLARDPDAHAGEEPLAALRHVAGKSTYDALLRDAPAAAVDAPLRAALARWVAHFIQARVTRGQEAEWALAASAREAVHPVDPKRRVSWREAWSGVLRAAPRGEAIAWLDAASERAPVLAPIARERRARRAEVARRLGLEGLDVLATRVPLATLELASEALLAATRDLWRDILREDRARLEVSRAAAVDAIRLAVGRDAPEGWPARLASDWLPPLFPGLTDGLRVDVGALPAPLGASSFMRALSAFGRAVRAAGPSPSLPFAMARDPAAADVHRFGYVFGALAASREFQRRALGNGERVAAAQARILARSALFEARLLAARFVLSRAPDRFEELTSDLLGAPMPGALAGAWPAARDDEPARALALFTALPLAQGLVERFDVDWFRNPRAVLFLRARASAPAFDETAELDAAGAARALARALEEPLA